MYFTKPDPKITMDIAHQDKGMVKFKIAELGYCLVNC